MCLPYQLSDRYLGSAGVERHLVPTLQVQRAGEYRGSQVGREKGKGLGVDGSKGSLERAKFDCPEAKKAPAVDEWCGAALRTAGAQRFQPTTR